MLLLLSTANLLSLSLAKSLVDPLPGFSLLTKTDPCYWFYFCLLLFFSLSLFLFTCAIFVFFVVVVVVVGKLLSEGGWRWALKSIGVFDVCTTCFVVYGGGGR